MTDLINEIEEASHLEIQYSLAKLGSDLNYQIWVARNDKNRVFNGNSLKDIPRILNELPRLTTDEKANKIIEMIDVLWLHNNQIMYSFEIEHTTSVYSGLLRQSDLICIHKNFKINPYIIYPDKRKDYVVSEINRETFVNNGLSENCKIISYSNLLKEIKETKSHIKMIRAEMFMDKISEKPLIKNIPEIIEIKKEFKESLKVDNVVFKEDKSLEIIKKENKKHKNPRKKISGFIFNGKEYKTNIVKDILKIICDISASENKDFSNKILSLPGLVKIKEDCFYPYNVKNTEIFIDTNLSHGGIIHYSNCVIKLFGYKTDNLIIKYI